MVDRTQGLTRIFHALADPTRRTMLRRLASGPLTVGELGEPFSISLAAVSKHVKALERAGLISREVHGREHHCRLEPGALEDAHAWLALFERFWSQRLDAREDLVAGGRDGDR